MPKYVYTYFQVKALGEGVRLLLAYGNEDWEDKRISGEEWPKYKSETPFGQLPVLEFDGKKFSQSIPLARYIARKHNLVGKTPEEDLEIEMNIEFLNDIRAKSAVVHYEADPIIKEKKFAELSKELFPSMVKKLNELVNKNNGHMACGKLTWADFVFAGLFQYVFIDMLRMPDIGAIYPALQKLHDDVINIPQVKAYYDKAYPA